MIHGADGSAGAKVGYVKVWKRFKTITPKKCQGQRPGGGEESTVTRGNVARSACGCGLRAWLAVRHRAALGYMEHLKRRKKIV